MHAPTHTLTNLHIHVHVLHNCLLRIFPFNFPFKFTGESIGCKIFASHTTSKGARLPAVQGEDTARTANGWAIIYPCPFTNNPTRHWGKPTVVNNELSPQSVGQARYDARVASVYAYKYRHLYVYVCVCFCDARLAAQPGWLSSLSSLPLLVAMLLLPLMTKQRVPLPEVLTHVHGLMNTLHTHMYIYICNLNNTCIFAMHSYLREYVCVVAETSKRPSNSHVITDLKNGCLLYDSTNRRPAV